MDKESLPQKKFLGNRDPTFIMRRRKDLETYLQNAFRFTRHCLPEPFVQFLDLPKYDVHHMARAMAVDCFFRENLRGTYPIIGPEASKKRPKPRFAATWTPLEMYALSERLTSARPEDDSDDRMYAFVNVADFACKLKELDLSGSTCRLGTSNIVPNSLPFDFVAFKNLNRLTLTNIDVKPEKIGSFGALRNVLTRLEATSCGLTSISAVLLGDVADGDPAQLESSTFDKLGWPSLKHLALEGNEIEAIDKGVRLAPNLVSLRLKNNKVKVIENLTSLPNLSVLDLSYNAVEAAESLHTKLGQITEINLSHNKLTGLSGCSKLYSLVSLNVSHNKICDLDSVLPTSKLPCMESLDLTGNRVTSVVDYRLKVFEAFGKKCSDLSLDGQIPSQSEIDCVSVLMALRVAKEGKSPTSLFGNLPRRL